tara:strand:- start:953 stop:1798 length:846 start_codon:yes stop_codon:yes gene_type:complete
MKFFADNLALFELNSNMEVRVEMIEEIYPVVIIENLYEDPDKMYDFVDRLPIPIADIEGKKHYGNRFTIDNFIANEKFLTNLSMILLHKLDMFDLIPIEHLKDVTNNNQFCLNTIHQDKKYGVTGDQRKESYIPHSDFNAITSIIYLTKDDIKTNGTGIYKHKKSQSVGYPQDDFQMDYLCDKEGLSKQDMKTKLGVLELNPTPLKYNECMLESNDEWELLWRSEGKFNSMVSYMGGLFHSALFDINELEDKKRLSQVVFWQFFGQHRHYPDKLKNLNRNL